MDRKKITYIEVLRRTFQGKEDPRKNFDVLTSKYSPSKKYLLRYKFAGYKYFVNEVYETKKLAEFAKEQLLKYHIDCRRGKVPIAAQLEMYGKIAAAHNKTMRNTPARDDR